MAALCLSAITVAFISAKSVCDMPCLSAITIKFLEINFLDMHLDIDVHSILHHHIKPPRCFMN